MELADLLHETAVDVILVEKFGGVFGKTLGEVLLQIKNDVGIGSLSHAAAGRFPSA